MSVHLHLCGGQRSSSDILLQVLFTCVLLARGSLIQLVWWDSKPQESICPCLPVLGAQAGTATPRFFLLVFFEIII